MFFMALDHANSFIGKQTYIGHEFWGGEFGSHPSFMLFLSRFASHFCAPGFVFLMAASMVFFRTHRKETGWSEGRIIGYFVRRGLVLIALQFIIENPAWMIGFGGSLLPIYLGVLYLLGSLMILGALLLRLSIPVLILLGVAIHIGAQWAIPPSETWSMPISPIWRFLSIPGTTAWVESYYPILPWIAPTLFGIIMGKLLQRDAPIWLRRMLPMGLLFITLFFLIRIFGGVAVNLRSFPEIYWWGWLYSTKYPPSTAYLFLHLGTGLVALSFFSRLPVSGLTALFRPLTILGKSALFFYVTHLYLYLVMGLAFPEGASLTVMALAWLSSFLILIPLCYLYGQFKNSRSPDSLWRLF
jgi:uncharacterized membrane protein